MATASCAPWKASAPARFANWLVHRLRANSRAGSRRNIAAHYDLGNDFYRLWLDPQMFYSSGIYRSGDETLEEAQRNKIDRVLELLDARKGESVLEIGCGWGGLAVGHGGERARAPITGLTLSREQLAHAQARVDRTRAAVAGAICGSRTIATLPAYSTASSRSR